MRIIWTLFKKDWLLFGKDKMAVALTFFVPMVLITIFGMIFGGNSSGPSGIRLLVVNENGSESAEKLIGKLKEEGTFRVSTRIRTEAGDRFRPMNRDDAKELLDTKASTYRYALVFPENLIDEEFGLNLELYYNPQNSVENQMVQGLLQKVFFMESLSILMNSAELGLTEEMQSAFNDDMAGVIAEHFGADKDEILESMDNGFFGMGGSEEAVDEEGETGVSGNASSPGGPFGELVQLEKHQVFGKGINPAAQSVGGWAVMFLLFSLTGAASALFEERDAGLFQRILTGYARRDHVLWSKFLFIGSLGLIQMLFLIAFGHLVFGVIENVGQIVPLLVIAALSAAAATSFGMLLCAVSRTPAQANGLGTLLILSMSALGGAMFPSFMIPEMIREWISPLTLVYWSMDGILGVLWRDQGLLELHLPIAVLSGISGVILGISVVLFRRGDLFR